MASISRFVPSREQRIDGIRHVVYEYGNLRVAAHYSLCGSAPWRTSCDDAFLLGCRKLDDFLMRDKRSKMYGQEQDDILALDYLPQGHRRSWSLPIWSAEWRLPMNKQLAHIAYCRDKEWNHVKWVPRLEREFRTAWLKFRESIVDEEYKRQFAELMGEGQGKEAFHAVTLD
jgi:hypothetical protein